MALTQISTDGIKNGTITGSDLATNVDLVDNQKIRFGTGNDLQIFHSGATAYILNNTGTLFALTDTFEIRGSNANETHLKTIDNGAVELYHNNSKKFETRSDGVTVTGALSTTSLSATGGITGTGGNFILGDSSGTSDDRIKLGASQDLELFHNGTNSFILSNSHPLILESDSLILRSDANEKYFEGTSNGAVDLYYNNSLRLSTTANGVTLGHNLFLDNATNAGRDVTWDPANDQLQWKDNTKASFGSSSDLQIFHDPQFGHSFIKESGPGALIFGSDLYEFYNAAISEKMLTATENGAVELYHDNSKKFQTESYGNQAFGEFFIGDGDGSDASNHIRLGNGGDLRIFHNGTHSFLENSTNSLYARSDEILLQSYTSNENYIIATLNGGVELYHDNNKKFETVAGGVKTNDNNYMGFGNSNDLQISHDGSTNIINGLYHPIELRHQAEVHIKCVDDGAVELYHNNSKKFETNSTGCFVAGSLGVNPSSTGDVTINKEGTGTLVRLRTTGTTRGTITSNGSTVAYNTSASDRSMKKNFEDWTENTLSLFKNINPQRFNFLDQEDGTDKEKGFIAQDLVTSFPEAYPKINDKYMFNPSAMVVYLMKAIQELETEVAALKTS